MRTLYPIDATVANLAGAATYLGPWVDITTYDLITATGYANVAGTLTIEQGNDGVNASASSTLTIAAATLNAGLSVPIVGTYARLKVVNGATIQTTHRSHLSGKRDSSANA